VSFYLPIFKKLNEFHIRYVVVGGLATVLHGHVRMTSDIDMIIDLEKDEAEKAIQVFESLGFAPRLPVPAEQFANENIRKHWITDKGMQVFSFHNTINPLLSLDLFVHHPIPFTELMSRSKIINIDGTQITICSIDDLITLKEQAGRPIDMDDIERLKEIKKENG